MACEYWNTSNPKSSYKVKANDTTVEYVHNLIKYINLTTCLWVDFFDLYMYISHLFVL